MNVPEHRISAHGTAMGASEYRRWSAATCAAYDRGDAVTYSYLMDRAWRECSEQQWSDVHERLGLTCWPRRAAARSEVQTAGEAPSDG